MAQVFTFDKMFAEEWGLDVNSAEFARRYEAMLKRASRGPIHIIPCGPPCDTCGDNSFDCGCNAGSN